MQINFFTSPQDEDDLVDYIYKRDGYFVDYTPGSRSFPVLLESPLPPATRRDFRDLLLSSVTIAPLPERRWLSKRSAFTRDDFLGPQGFRFESIEFTRSFSDGSKLYPGRLWLNGLEDPTIRFYQSICRRIRKTFTKDEADWWVGPNTEAYCKEENLEKANSALSTG